MMRSAAHIPPDLAPVIDREPDSCAKHATTTDDLRANREYKSVELALNPVPMVAMVAALNVTMIPASNAYSIDLSVILADELSDEPHDTFSLLNAPVDNDSLARVVACCSPSRRPQNSRHRPADRALTAGGVCTNSAPTK